MFRLTIVLIVASSLAACATQGVNTTNYTPATPVHINNEKVISRPQPAVWDELVRELSKSFYVINNIERESRIINVSFNSNSPSEYVDCGRTRRVYTQGDNVETFEYAVAEKARFKFAAARQEQPTFINYSIVEREPSLEGRANIYVAPDPQSASQTVVSVNTRYVVTVRTHGDAFAQNLSGRVFSRGALRDQTASYIFSTNKPASTDIGGTRIVCSGTGRLENDILNMVR